MKFKNWFLEASIRLYFYVLLLFIDDMIDFFNLISIILSIQLLFYIHKNIINQNFK